eukprot:1465108-Rhodomonas_salina.2
MSGTDRAYGGTREDAEKCFAAGMTDVIAKPIKRESGTEAGRVVPGADKEDQRPPRDSQAGNPPPGQQGARESRGGERRREEEGGEREKGGGR